MGKQISLSLIGVFVVFFVQAQAWDPVKLDQYFDRLEASQHFMGTVYVRQGDSLLYTRSIGKARLEEKTKADSSTRYHIGSISQIYTAVLLLKAVEEGRIRLEDNIKEYFPQIEKAENIRVSDLLRHRSGIPNFTEHPLYSTWYTQNRTRNELLEIISKEGLHFSPGTHTAYSNSNYVLLSFLLEDLYQQAYSRLLSTYITGPLDLKSTYLGSSIDPSPEEAYAYTYNKQWVQDPATHYSIVLGAGGLVSTPAELTRFIHALFHGKLLNPSSLEAMRRLEDDLGLGLFSYSFDTQKALGNHGNIDGFHALLQYYPQGDISYAISSNATRMDINQISAIVLSALMGKPYPLPEFNQTIDASQWNAYLGVYTSPEIPVELRLYKEGNQWMLQGLGSQALSLEPKDAQTLQHLSSGILLQRIPDENQILLKQAERDFLFTKDVRKMSW